MPSVPCPSCARVVPPANGGAGQDVCPHCGYRSEPTVSLPPATDPFATLPFDRGVGTTAYRAWPFLAPPQREDEIGRLGAFRILGLLGQGGMGVVFEAEDQHLQRHVALKVMLPHLAASEAGKGRFLREARSAASIDHDHIVAVHQVGEEGGVPYLVMPLLRGRTLEEWTRSHPRPSLADVLRIGREIASGLSAAHERGLIHRDIKPANVWLESKDESSPAFRVKILDFGLARAASGENQLTRSGVVVGTPAYMAPEQGRGEPTDRRSDLFSLGCILYRLATGRPPFAGTDFVSTLVEIATKNPEPPSRIDPSIPLALSQLVMRLLEKMPENRPASANEVADALARMEVNPPSAGQPGRIAPRRAARSRWKRIAWAVGAVALLAEAVFLASMFFGPPVDEVAPTPRPVLSPVVEKGPDEPRPVRPALEDRKLAEWTLDLGGTVEVTTAEKPDPEEVTAAAMLPAGPFRVYGVSLWGSDKITDEKLAFLRDAKGVKSISLGATPISNKGLTFLEDLPELELLGLNNSGVTDAGLVSLKGLRSLKRLILDSTRIEGKGLAHLAGLANLEDLNMGMCKNMTRAGFAEMGKLGQVRSLHLMGNCIDDAGLLSLAGMKELQTIYLGKTAVTDKGAAAFRNMVELRAVWLEDTGIGDAGLIHFAGSTKLRSLVLFRTKVKGPGLKHLEGLASLQTLSLPEDADPAAIAKLGMALPNCKIVRAKTRTNGK